MSVIYLGGQMWDPKRLNEDRTPPPLVDAPRDPRDRPTFTPEPITPKRFRSRRAFGRENSTPEHRRKVMANRLAWRQQMADRYGPKWRKKWLAYKKATGRKSFDPNTEDLTSWPTKQKRP
jgi:hypothetical protein